LTDLDLLAKKLAAIETYVRELRDVAHPERIGSDVREERFIAHTLQLAVQAVLDAAAHVVADEKLGEPRQYRDLFTILSQAGWISEPLGQALTKMAGFRNILVHGYETIDLAIVRDVVENRLDDLVAFCVAMRGRAFGARSGA
jgi:uncharacterized protein YutE (UPF0331/DUF86 family)